MSDKTSSRSSPPPPPPHHRERVLTPPSGIAAQYVDPDETGRHAVVEILGRQETPVERATRIAEEARKGVRDLWENGIGKPPAPKAGFEGSGLWKVVAQTHDIASETRAIVSAAQVVKDKWSLRTGAAVWEVFKYILIAALAATLTWVSGLRTQHPAPQQPPAQQGK